MYPWIEDAIEYAVKSGFQVGLVTNGAPATKTRSKNLARHIKSIAVSLDGLETTHDKIRDRRGAYQQAVRGIGNLKDAGFDVSVIHTLTSQTVTELDSFVEECIKLDIDNLQIHPIENTGNAAKNAASPYSNREICSKAQLLMMLIDPPINWQIDCFNRESIKSNPSSLGIIDLVNDRPQQQILANYINPIVIKETGSVVPYQYDIPDLFRITNTDSESPEADITDFLTNTFPVIQDIITQLLPDALDPEKLPFFNWYERLSQGMNNYEDISS